MVFDHVIFTYVLFNAFALCSVLDAYGLYQVSCLFSPAGLHWAW